MGSRILLVGNDRNLLATRAAIVNLRWPSSSVSSKDAIREIKAGTPDLLVLCHTLSVQEAKELVDLCRSQSPHIHTLALDAAGSFARKVGADAAVENMPPGPMLNAIETLLEKDHSRASTQE